MTLDDGDEPLSPTAVAEDASAIACLSEKGRLLVFGLNEIKQLSSGGRGVILMELETRKNSWRQLRSAKRCQGAWHRARRQGTKK